MSATDTNAHIYELTCMPLQQPYQNGQQSNLMVTDPLAALKSNIAVQSQYPNQVPHQVIIYYTCTVYKQRCGCIDNKFNGRTWIAFLMS